MEMDPPQTAEEARAAIAKGCFGAAVCYMAFLVWSGKEDKYHSINQSQDEEHLLAVLGRHLTPHVFVFLSFPFLLIHFLVRRNRHLYPLQQEDEEALALA